MLHEPLRPGAEVEPHCAGDLADQLGVVCEGRDVRARHGRERRRSIHHGGGGEERECVEHGEGLLGALFRDATLAMEGLVTVITYGAESSDFDNLVKLKDASERKHGKGILASVSAALECNEWYSVRLNSLVQLRVELAQHMPKNDECMKALKDLSPLSADDGIKLSSIAEQYAFAAKDLPNEIMQPFREALKASLFFSASRLRGIMATRPDDPNADSPDIRAPGVWTRPISTCEWVGFGLRAFAFGSVAFWRLCPLVVSMKRLDQTAHSRPQYCGLCHHRESLRPHLLRACLGTL